MSGMKELILCTKTSQSLLTIGPGAMDEAGKSCQQLCSGAKVAVITDSNVAPLYADKVSSVLKASGFAPQVLVLPAGEESKNLGTVSNIYAFLSDHAFTRSDLAIALGGGVVGDIVGFSAATYLRGIKSIQIPTTLLAQVDSSVGGKCGVDLPQGKNLVGAFNQPNRVLIDTAALGTLPERIFCDGMAEVIKYGCIFDEEFFSRLEQTPAREILPYVVERCVALKRDVVERDEHDTSERMLLNFGHTIGHAIEKCGGFTCYSHGQAVAMGMVAAARLGEAMGVTPAGMSQRIGALVSRYQLDASVPYPADQILSAMRMDKKNLEGVLNFILLDRIGRAQIHPMPFSKASELISKILS